MIHRTPIITLAGGLILVLVSTSCSSSPDNKRTVTPAKPGMTQDPVDNKRTVTMAKPGTQDTVADRAASQEDRFASSQNKDRATLADRTSPDRIANQDEGVASSGDRFATTDGMSSADRRPLTEEQIPGNRMGSSENRLASDRVVPCADQKNDSTTSIDCGPQNRRLNDDRTAYGRTAHDSRARATGCASHTDAKGNVIYDDPTCPTRYRQPHEQMGSSYQNVDITKESAFFDRYIGKAVHHARAAEVAGHLGNAPELRQHAQLSLEQAKEAQRAGNVPGLNEGIMALRETLSMPPDASVQDATAHVRDARVNLSQAGGMRATDTGTAARAVRTNTMTGERTRTTIKGELISDTSSGRIDGGQHYRLRDQNGKDIPISLSQDMSRTVREGDMVEAQLDSEGRVLAISKDR